MKDKLANGIWTGYEWNIEVQPDSGSGTPNTPNSAISLATVAVSANTVSVVDSNILDTRGRSVVGTPAITGDLLASGIHSSYGGRDGTRPLTFQKNPDGWVMLSGWFRRSGGSTAVTKDTTYWLDGGTAESGSALLPVEARPSGVRDFIGLTSNGYVHYAVYPNGRMSFRFNYATTLSQNLSWFTLDGCSYRANAF